MICCQTMRCVANSHLVAAKNLSWIELEPLVSRGVLICHNRCRKGSLVVVVKEEEGSKKEVSFKDIVQPI